MLVCLLQYIGLTLTTLSPAPLWAASGAACAFIFLRGLSILPGIGLGSALAFYFATWNLIVAIGGGLLLMLQAWLLLFICYRYLYPTLLFHSTKRWLWFIFACSLISSVVSFLLLTLLALPLSLLVYAVFANMNGILIVGCALVALDAYFPEWQTLRKSHLRHLYAYYGLIVTLCILLLFNQHTLTIIILNAVLVITLLVASRTLQWHGTIAALFIYGMLLSIGAYLNTPLFATDDYLGTQVFLSAMLFACTVLGLWRSI